MEENNNKTTGEDLKKAARKTTSTLTAKDVQRIIKLPRKQMRVGGVIQEVIYDEVTGYLYYPNPNPKGVSDILLSKRTKYEPTKEEEKVEEKKADAESAEAAQEQPEPEAEPQQRKAETSVVSTKKEVPKKPKKKKALGVAIAFVAVVALGAMALPVIRDYLPVGGHSSETGQSVAIGETTAIVQVVRDLIPGDVVTAEDIQKADINTETYNQIALQGVNLYQWNKSDTLLGMYVQSYLPAGQYVSFTSVGASYEPPQSLWHPDKYIDIPLTNAQKDDKLYIPGEKVNITIRKEVKSESPVETSKKTLGQGGTAVTIQQAITVDEFMIPAATICDVFSGDPSGEAPGSMYELLDALSEVPAGEQATYILSAVEHGLFEGKLDQNYIRIYLNEEDKALIGDITNADSVTITLSTTDTYSKDNDDRANFVAAAQATVGNLQTALSGQEGE